MLKLFLFVVFFTSAFRFGWGCLVSVQPSSDSQDHVICALVADAALTVYAAWLLWGFNGP